MCGRGNGQAIAVLTNNVIQRVRRRFNQGVKEFSLIEPSDSILIGLSGGKDSLALLQLLGEMRKRRNFSFTITALHVRMKGVDYRIAVDYLREQSQTAGAEFIVKETEIGVDTNERRTPCFLCSWKRRKLLFETAQELGCNKIALGHHFDDIITTALMNLTYSGQFSTMPALLKMHKMPLTIIRPLCRISENDLKQWALHFDYQRQEKTCPYERESKRTEIARLSDLMQKMNPEYRESIWHALEKSGKLVEQE